MKRKVKKFIQISLITAVSLSLCACSNSASRKQSVNRSSLTNSIAPETIEGKEPDEDFITATADFSIELFKQEALDEISDGNNVLVSPESVLTALAMTANGANGTTRSDMEQVICGGMAIQDFNPYMYTYNNQLTQSEDVSFHLANSIWIKDNPEEIQVKEEFLQTDKTYFDAEAFLADFDETTIQDINHWVDANTDGMIDSLLNEIPDGVVMYLINALAFEGQWETPYEEQQIDEDGIFTNSSGTEETVAMLNSTECQYISSTNATGFIKNYEGNDYAFLALLPNEDIAMDDYVASMTGNEFIELFQNREYRDVIVKLPEFTYDYSTELSEPLSEMGMESAFSISADFSNMAETDTGALYISRVLHKTYIQVDRSGTKAAAVTAVEMDKETAMIEPETPPVVNLDRPFVYAIIDTHTGIPIFIGTVNTIE